MTTTTDHQDAFIELEVPIAFTARVSVRPDDTDWRGALTASAQDEVHEIIQGLDAMPLADD